MQQMCTKPMYGCTCSRCGYLFSSPNQKASLCAACNTVILGLMDQGRLQVERAADTEDHKPGSW